MSIFFCQIVAVRRRFHKLCGNTSNYKTTTGFLVLKKKEISFNAESYSYFFKDPIIIFNILTCRFLHKTFPLNSIIYSKGRMHNYISCQSTIFTGLKQLKSIIVVETALFNLKCALPKCTYPLIKRSRESIAFKRLRK